MTGGALPPFPDGLVGLLATVDADGRPHAIPVSALHRAGPRRVLIGLAPGRGSLSRLRRRPAAALALLAEGFALTAEGTASVVAEELPGAPHVVGVELRVERLLDTLGTRTRIHAGVSWSWREDVRGRDGASPGERHDATLAGLAAVARRSPGGAGAAG